MFDSDFPTPPVLTPPSYHHLLVAIDGSPHADLALSAAVSVALREHSTITLIAVAAELTTTVGSWAAAYIPPLTLEERIEPAERCLHRAVALIPVEIGVRTICREGKPGPVIVEVANSGDYDAVMMGARGRGRLGTAMGSVSQHVLHHAQIPVLVAHQPPRTPVADADVVSSATPPAGR